MNVNAVKKREGSARYSGTSLLKPYNAYCKSKNIRKEDKLKKDILWRVYVEIFREIGMQMVKKPGGVFIKGFGYFFVMVSKGHIARRLSADPNKVVYNFNRKGEKIRLTFMPFVKHTDLYYWSMDYKFKSPLYEEIKEQVIAGKKYEVYFSTMRKLLGLPVDEKRRPITTKEYDGNEQS